MGKDTQHWRMNRQTMQLQKTPLWDIHSKTGAKMVDFAGWSMPIQYSGGIIKEVNAVRTQVGLFDVSHMARIEFGGAQATQFMDYLLGANIAKLQHNNAKYTLICKANGAIVDDCIVYRLTDNEYLLIINAARKDVDMAWINQLAIEFNQLTIKDVTADIAMIAVQGPQAVAMMGELTAGSAPNINKFTAETLKLAGADALVARTGYTGEDGFEVMIPATAAPDFWESLTAKGASACGLGARDVLRLEAGLMLYGNDITESENPYEAALSWTISLKKEANYIAKAALAQIKQTGVERRIAGVRLSENGVPRAGMKLFDSTGQTEIGALTSGTFSPTLQVGIGMGYIKKQLFEIGAQIKVSIRDQMKAAEIVALPFYKNT